jgi:hypothetical protein
MLIGLRQFVTSSRTMYAFPTAARTVAEVLPLASKCWPPASPFCAEDFSRQDESSDARFYEAPRFCYHVDDAAVESLTRYYSVAFRKWTRPSILDMCASHVSHFPPDVASFSGRRVALGMNRLELQSNPQVDEFVVHDLNQHPVLPFDDNSFDVVTNVVSIDYITHPLAVCKEISRVLRPGGAAIFSLSNRCFPSKAVNVWLRCNDLQHVLIVGAYLHYASGFKAAVAEEISPGKETSPWLRGLSQNNAYMSVVTAFVDK